MKILVAGGGTAGHINPNLAILSELKKQVEDIDVLYIGSAKGMEAEIVPKAGWRFVGISCGKLRRYFSWENFVDFFRVIRGIWQSFWLIRKFEPQLIFCKGGYVSLPVAIAGGLLGKTVIIHESDAEMGLANKIAAKFAKLICLSFANGRLNGKKFVITGNPVRPELAHGNREKARLLTKFNNNKPVILVMGGSQGADFINKLIWKNFDELLNKFQIIHAYGKGKGTDLPKKADSNGYFHCEYLGDELKDIYQITDLIVSRAGANSLAEIEFIGIPTLLIPLVHGSRGDQITNARIFAENYPAMVVDEREINPNTFDLVSKIDQLIGRRTEIGGLKKTNPALSIANIILEQIKDEQD